MKFINFVGNKNTCAIDLDVVLDESSGIASTIYTVHDGAYGNYSTLGGGLNGGTRYVLPTQGFMFVTTDGTNSLNISHNIVFLRHKDMNKADLFSSKF